VKRQALRGALLSLRQEPDRPEPAPAPHRDRVPGAGADPTADPTWTLGSFRTLGDRLR